jgi:hypothetical protein
LVQIKIFSLSFEKRAWKMNQHFPLSKDGNEAENNGGNDCNDKSKEDEGGDKGGDLAKLVINMLRSRSNNGGGGAEHYDLLRWRNQDAQSLAIQVGLSPEGFATQPKLNNLASDGFEVRTKAFVLPEVVLAKLHEHSQDDSYLWNDENAEIFNNGKLGKEAENDKRRKQVPAEWFHDSMVDAMHDLIDIKLKEYYPSLQPNKMVMLKSLPGCSAQLAHTDFTTDDLEGITDESPEKMPLGCLIALMDNTPFNVWRGAFNCFTEPANEARFRRETIVLNAGDMLIFCGDLVHAGAAFNNRNIRLHCYLDSEHVKRTANSTCFMDSAVWILDLV